MASIAIFHPSIMAMGGGEAVCINTLAALEDIHEVTLVTVDKPDFKELNEYYNTDISQVNVDRSFPVGEIISNISNIFNISESKYWHIRNSLLKRYWNANDYELIISTVNEYSFDSQAIQYIHYPNSSVDYQKIHTLLYTYICDQISGSDPEKIRNTRLLTNSDWTASITSDIYNKYPEVVYPPINTNEFESVTRSWKEREKGFICIGRVKPQKNILRNIEIVSQLRKKGFDVHLHIIGPISDNNYGESVRKAATDQEGVFLEGRVRRDRLVNFIKTHKYGIHGKENEHFGMAVAELVAGGTLPVVHNSGGQREIVSQQDQLLYDTASEAVDNISNILNRDDKGKSLIDNLPNVEDEFGRERFRRAIREEVKHHLD